MKVRNLLLLTSILMLSFNSVFAQLEWVTFDGELPSNAVIGGTVKNDGLAVCRCDYKGAMHPGKVVAKACNIGWGGKENISKNFEVLINKGLVHLDWEKSSGALPADAVQGGSEGGKPIYIGRAFHKNGTHPGKVFKVESNYICNIGWGGKEITLKTFEVLVEHKPDHTVERISHDGRCESKKYKKTPSEGIYIGRATKNSQINEGQSLVSSNLKYQSRVTKDGRLVVEEIMDRVLCDDGRILIFKAKEIWSNTTTGGDPSLDYFMKFQEDGNLCIYSEQKGFVWCSMSNGKNGHHLELTNIGHIEVVNDHGGEIWPD